MSAGWFDASDRLARDIGCVSCGYNLRGMTRQENCGECGGPVRWTLQGHFLYFRDPLSLEALRSACADALMLLPWVWIPLLWPLFAVSIWKLTQPDPTRRPGGDPLRSGISRTLLTLTPCGLGIVFLPLSVGYMYARAPLIGYDPLWMSLSLTLVCLLVIPLILSIVLTRIGQESASKWFLRTCWAAMRLSLAGMAGLAVLLVGLTTTLSTLVTSFFAGVGILSGALALLFTGFALAMAWRELDMATTQARSLTDDVQYWRGRIPGEAFSSAAKR